MRGRQVGVTLGLWPPSPTERIAWLSAYSWAWHENTAEPGGKRIRMVSMTRSHSLFLAAVAAALTVATAFGADSTCKYLADANAKIYTIPAHLYQTDTTSGKTQTSELIYLDNKAYLKTAGTWRPNPMTPSRLAQIRKATEDEEIKTMTCRAVRDEAVNGEASTLYSSHQESEQGKRDSQIWISKSRGVPLKLEMDDGKNHRSIRYEYTNVQVPQGVR